jgi:hypothetical protein
MFSRCFPSRCALATVDSFRSILDHLVAPLADPGNRIGLLYTIQHARLDAEDLRLQYRVFRVPEEEIPTVAIAELFTFSAPHCQDNINAIRELIASTNTTGIHQVAVGGSGGGASSLTADSPPDASGNGST